MAAGILNIKEVQDLVSGSKLERPSGKTWAQLIGHSSFDLPLGEEYWEMRGSCRAGKGWKVRDDIIPRFAKTPEPKTLTGEIVLQRGHVYVFRADCRVNLKNERILGKATGKSSVGRLDVLVRLLVDGCDSFDLLPENYSGNLYIEVTPITFPLLVRPGVSLSQLRLCRGPQHLSTLSMEALSYEDESFPVLDRDGRPLKDFCTDNPGELFYPFSLDLAPDPKTGFSAFVAKGVNDIPEVPIDLEKRDAYDPKLYWEPVKWENSSIDLQLDRLYILRSRERLKMPAHLALECKSYTETMGEWRIEYAGFAHPFFGRTRGNGTPIIFEVRGHNIPTILTDSIPLGNVSFRRMSSPAAAEDAEADGDYENQELKLSKCFKDWPPDLGGVE